MKEKSVSPTASLILIGNELLTGQTQDKNLHFIAHELFQMGITLEEVSVIPDDEDRIIETVNIHRKKYDTVFTTGGIGPTHDDITSLAVSKALGKKLIRNQEALQRLIDKYGEEQINEARASMADMPEGSTLIDNPISAAPGFQIENVYVLAGVPKIMKEMFAFVKKGLKPGQTKKVIQLVTSLKEGDVAGILTEVQNQFPEVEMGSYPHFYDENPHLKLVLRSTEEEALKQARDVLLENVSSLKVCNN